MLRFLHCADAHLDTPFSILLRREFASVPDCHIFIAPGNHDFYADDAIYNTAAFSENVHIFKSDLPSCFSLSIPDETGHPTAVEVWGFANTAPAMNGCEILQGFVPGTKQPGTHRLFVGHAALEGCRAEDSETGYAPLLKKEQLAAAGFDYCALGHYHTSDGVRRIEVTASGKTRTTYFSYAGCLVGRGFAEPGLRGAVCGTLSFDEHGDTVFSVRRLRIARRRYECLEVDLDRIPDTPKTDAGLLQIFTDALHQAVSEKQMAAPDRDTALRLTVTGTLPAELLLSEDRIAEALGPLASLVLIDRTTPGETAALASDPTLRGAYFHALADKLFADDPTLRETAALALRLGMQEFKHD